jgi:hypothetical protein
MNGDKIIDEEQIIAERKQELLDLLKILNEHYHIIHPHSHQRPKLTIKKTLSYGIYADCLYSIDFYIQMSYKAVLDDIYISTFLHEYAHILWFTRKMCRKSIQVKQKEIKSLKNQLKTWKFEISTTNPMLFDIAREIQSKKKRIKWHDDEFCQCLENILLFVFGDVWKYDFNHDYKYIKKWFEQKYKKKETTPH